MTLGLFLFAIVVLSQATTLIRYAEAPSLAICFWRLAMASAMLAPFALRRSKREPLGRLGRGDHARLILCGVFLFLHFYSFFRGVQKTSVANSTILFSLNPVTTALGAYIFFHERVSRRLAVAGLLGISGVVVLFGEELWGAPLAISSTSGNVWSVLSAVFFSGYVLTGKHLRRQLSNTFFAFAVYLQTAALAGAAMLILGLPFFGYSDLTWWMFLALAVFPTLLGHAIFSYCLNGLDVNFMSCMTLVEPILSALVAYWLFTEPLTPHATLGFLLTVASVLVLLALPQGMGPKALHLRRRPERSAS